MEGEIATGVSVERVVDQDPCGFDIAGVGLIVEGKGDAGVKLVGQCPFGKPA